MEGAKAWRIGLLITWIVFNIAEVVIMVVTGSAAIGDCLPPKLFNEWSACVADLGIGKIAIAAWLPGNILLVALIAVTFIVPALQKRRGGGEAGVTEKTPLAEPDGPELPDIDL